MELKEQTGDEQWGEGHPRPGGDGLGVAAAHENSRDDRLGPHERLPVVEDDGCGGEAEEDDEGGEGGDEGGAGAGQEEEKGDPG